MLNFIYQHMINNLAGIGLRQPHFKEFLENLPSIAWVEVHTENFFAEGGSSLSTLEQIAKDYPISFHGVGLSIGSADEISISHLKKLKTLIENFNPFLVSEHLSWSSVNDTFINDLLPIPYTRESFLLFANKIDQIQQYLGREILIENPSTYIEFADSDMAESIFLNKLAEQTKCGILLDVNNLYVNSINHSIDAMQYLGDLNSDFIKEIHLAGHSSLEGSNILIDTNDSHVADAVWDLYSSVIKMHGAKPTLLEWDDKLPSLNQLIDEALKSETIVNKINGRKLNVI